MSTKSYSTILYVVLVFLSPFQISGFVPLGQLKPSFVYSHGNGHSVTTSPSEHDIEEMNNNKNNDNNLKPPSKRLRFLNKLGFKRVSHDQKEIREAASAKKVPETFEITNLRDLDSYFADKQRRFRNKEGKIDSDSLIRSLSVCGDTQIIGSTEHLDYVHPVAKLLHERKANGSQCVEGGKRDDGCKIALVIEGGGMRGCISGGMVCAINYLGLRDAVDVVYGSSAGSVVGAYFITGQLQWLGPEVYYDKLTTAGKNFIDTSRLLRVLGFGLADPRLFKDVLGRRNNGKPVLNLPFLLKETMQRTKPLDWEKFAQRQKVQPLKVVASGLKRQEAVVMGMESGHFTSIEEMSECMHASCLLPGIAGPVMNIKSNENNDPEKPKFVIRNGLDDPDYEPVADALVHGPLPYESAFKEGATHVIVLRSRADGTDVTGKGGVLERLIFRRFFLRKNKLPNVFQYMSHQLHKKLYAKNIIEMNEAAHSTRDYKDTSEPHTLALALPPGSEEIARLEVDRKAIFEGVRRGFARAYDALVEDPKERGRGHIVAKEYFPDEILDYSPEDIARVDDSAFRIFMEQESISPKSWANKK
ncbi:unnamed protein product [Cylindrotheca closterium]|uniref:PNPLA domain-containing protein n=1 Tax=Cylindrotheca closterium TaxID=2856 RepID=A0AAD2JQ38_9STRA|nr:unnamed protein product [Cylindrotheca closterium]